jgi:hypothetical protein
MDPQIQSCKRLRADNTAVGCTFSMLGRPRPKRMFHRTISLALSKSETAKFFLSHTGRIAITGYSPLKPG